MAGLDTGGSPDMKFTTRRARRLFRIAAAGTAAALATGTAVTVMPAGAAEVNGVRVSDATVVEGNSGTSSAVFTITYKNTTLGIERVSYETRALSAESVDDFTPQAGTITAVRGQRIYTVTVPVTGDEFDEPNEIFELRLHTSENAAIGDGVGVGEIINDDGPPAELGVVTSTLDEGDTDSRQSIELSLSHAVGVPVRAKWQTLANTATASDFVPGSGEVVFDPGVIAATIPVDVVGDLRDEVNETFSLVFSDVRNAIAVDVSSEISILDNDGLSTLSVADIDLDEGTGGTGAAVFTVSLTPPSEHPVTVGYATVAADTARPAGFTGRSGTVVFPAGSEQQLLSFPVATDNIDEFDETFYLNLTGPNNVVVDDSQALATIKDDDAEPTILLAPTTVTVGEADGSLPFTTKLSNVSGKNVTFNVQAVPGTAKAADFDTAPIPVSFAAYSPVTSFPANVTVVDDALDEDEETLTFFASDASNAVAPTTGVTGKITDNDVTPTVTIADVTVGEHDTDQVVAPVKVALSAVSGRDVSLAYTTVAAPAGPGVADAGTDYTATSGRVTIKAGDPDATIEIPIPADALDEDDEVFAVRFSNAVNTFAPAADTKVTIVDADSMVNITMADLSVVEGTGGTTTAQIPVRLSSAAGRVVKVDYGTVTGTAPTADYTAQAGSLTFARGETQKTISVPIRTDSTDEFDGTFTIELRNAQNVELADATSLVTIVDDDAAPTLTIDGSTIAEPTSGYKWGVTTLRLSAASAKTIKVNFRTVDATAKTASGDYETRLTSVNIAPGTTRLVLQTVKILPDDLDEPQEAVTISFTRALEATLATTAATVLIDDTDSPVEISIADASVQEGDSGATNALFNVSLSAPSGFDVTVGYKTANGSATGGTDYKVFDSTLTIPAGATTSSVTIPAFADTTDEDDETFTVSLVNPANVVIARAVATGTIVDNDPLPNVTLGSLQIVEGDTGTKAANVAVTLTGRTARTVTVRVVTADGTALAGTDYQAVDTTVTFAPGERTKTVAVPVVGDVDDETTESFTVGIAEINNATGGTAATVEILDND